MCDSTAKDGKSIDLKLNAVVGHLWAFEQIRKFSTTARVFDIGFQDRKVQYFKWRWQQYGTAAQKPPHVPCVRFYSEIREKYRLEVKRRCKAFVGVWADKEIFHHWKGDDERICLCERTLFIERLILSCECNRLNIELQMWEFSAENQGEFLPETAWYIFKQEKDMASLSRHVKDTTAGRADCHAVFGQSRA